MFPAAKQAARRGLQLKTKKRVRSKGVRPTHLTEPPYIDKNGSNRVQEFPHHQMIQFDYGPTIKDRVPRVE